MSMKIIQIVLVSALLSITSGPFAATYYVATSGSNSRNCAEAQNAAKPRLTVNAGCECLSEGDTLYLRSGTYEEAIRGSTSFPIPSGTSWSAATTIASYPCETATLRPPQGGYGVFDFGRSGAQYIIIDRLVLDGFYAMGAVIRCEGGIDKSMCFHHIRIQNSEIMNATRFITDPDPTKYYGDGISACGDGIEILNNSIHDNGVTDFDHGVYIGQNDILVVGNDIYRNAGWGIHKYSKGDNWIISNNRVHDNARLGKRGVGMGLYGGTNNLVYNNIIWGNQDGISARYGESDLQLFANTIFNNAGCGICNEAPNSVIMNNIVYGNGGLIDDQSSRTTVDYNLAGTDPLFVNAAAADFHLQTGSPAIDAGADLSSEGFATDFDGVARPQGSQWDIGAYEYSDNRTAVSQFAKSRSAHRTFTDATVSVFDIRGRKIAACKVGASDNACIRNLDGAVRGVYILRSGAAAERIVVGW